MKRIFLLSLVALFLIGCAEPPQRSEGGNEQAVIDGCRDYYQKQLDLENAQYYSIPEGQRALVLTNRDTMRMIERTFGKSEDPCRPGTNFYDAYIAYVEEHNKTIRQISEDGFGFAKHGTTVFGVFGVVDSIADKVGDNVSGDKVTSGHDTNQAGGDIAIEGNTEIEDHVTTTQTQFSDEDSVIEPVAVTDTESTENIAEGIEE